MALPVLDDDELQKIYVWVDSVPLSRPKRNISRDFSDGVLVAEVVHHYFPRLVELHNYSGANSLRQKLYNWGTLNQKVFKRLGFEVKRSDVEAIVNCKPGVIEAVLMQLQQMMAEYRAGRRPDAQQQQQGGGGDASPPLVDYYSSSSSRLAASAPAASSGGGGGGAGRASSAAAAIADAGGGYLSAAAAPSSSSSSGLSGGGGAHAAAAAAALAERDGALAELRETVEILELKMRKLEQLVRLKDTRIATLTARLAGAGISATSAGAAPGQ